MTILPKILIIDDEPDNFDVLETLLYNQGYELNYVANAQQAFNFLTHTLPDVILLDVMMPQINGIQFCKLFKSNSSWQHIPIIMVTALSSKEDLQQCLSAGADDFISKPVNAIELRCRVHSMLRIKQQYDSLQETLHLREDLSNMIVHDLRNPLSAIMMSAEILQSTDYSPERQQQKTHQILMNVKKLQSMIDSVLIMAKINSGKMILQLTETDIVDICNSAVEDIQIILNQNNLQVITKLPPPGNKISLDATLCRRLIDNLLSNAIKFSPANSQILLYVDYPQTTKLKIQVIDSGPGVPEELKDIIFNKYEIGNLIKGVSQIGLGLAFCKMTVEAHGGYIKVESNHPTGAIFSVEI